jgi:GxxExxY protein
MKPKITQIEDKKEFLYKELSYKIVGLAMEIHKKLGSGFLEKVYENSLMVLFERENIQIKQQFPINVNFENKIVGNYIADIVVDDKIIIEIKAVESLNNVHKAQLINYLKATGFKVGILLNFGSQSLEHQRFIYN